MTAWDDRKLGMGRRINRRDFLNGVALSVGGLAITPSMVDAWAQAQTGDPKDSGYYPPALTGMRGSHPGAFDAAHALRDGTFWDHAGTAQDTGEKYDLVIVGGGISGLSAAHFYRQLAGAQTKVLIIENHDDFGGHAKRNEFTAGGRMLLGFGGTYSIESPEPYSAVAKALIEELGIDVSSFPKRNDRKVYSSHRLKHAVFFDRETFGADKLVRYAADEEADTESGGVFRSAPPKEFLERAPLNQTAKRDLARLYAESRDFYPGLSSTDKKARLARVSYADYLTKIAGYDPQVVTLLQTLPQGLFGIGVDAIAAQDAWGLNFPGFGGLNLDPVPGKGMNRDAIPNEEAEKYFFHFPDGNSSIARLLVRHLIPAAMPGKTADDVVTARADYARLDEAGSPIRIRLNSTAVRVKHVGDPATAKETEIVYSRRGKIYSVRAGCTVLACWHVVIPYICDELPAEQKAALSDAAKVPLVYSNVAIANWRAFTKLGVQSVYSPGSYHSSFHLDMPVSIGAYQCSKSPDEPVVVHMLRTPCKPGLPARDQHRLGRIELFSTTLETFERKIRDQLARSLGDGGFDPARDITGITVNRWPHGYAYEYSSLWDTFWRDGTTPPCVVARKRFGRIAIANADADAYAYTDCAMDQAYRAVQELAGSIKS